MIEGDYASQEADLPLASTPNNLWNTSLPVSPKSGPSQTTSVLDDNAKAKARLPRSSFNTDSNIESFATTGPSTSFRETKEIPSYGCSGSAIWSYAVNTLDPVINHTLLSHDNHYYLLCLLRRYTPRCHPTYLTPRAHVKLSAPRAFDNLRIHTDEVAEVVERMTPDTLTIAVLMDSLDWFGEREREEVRRQVRLLRRALKDSGRVLMRSAGMRPRWVDVFEEEGFRVRRVNVRLPGCCVDR